jgi:hypothetical protein
MPVSDTQSKQPKKAYVPPTLKVFGDLSTLTAAVANNSTVTDGGTMSMQKTQ